MVPDEDLVGLVCAGGTQREEAWRELVRRHTPRMVAVARSFGLDGPACDDLVQTVPLQIGANTGPGYRTYSQQTVVPSRRGTWRRVGRCRSCCFSAM